MVKQPFNERMDYQSKKKRSMSRDNLETWDRSLRKPSPPIPLRNQSLAKSKS